MKTLEIKTNVRVYEPQELPEDLRELVNRAKLKCQDSYAPYSKFHVGAAIRMENGDIFSGCNQENAAYPSGLCAERTTLFYAQAQRPKEPVIALAIAAETNGKFTDLPTPPCGACRQVMIETEQRGGKPMQIILAGEKAVYVIDSAKDLMPLVFDELY